MRLPHISQVAAYFSKVRISHTFSAYIGISTAIFIILIFLLKQYSIYEDCAHRLIDINNYSNKKISTQVPPTACLLAQ